MTHHIINGWDLIEARSRQEGDVEAHLHHKQRFPRPVGASARFAAATGVAARVGAAPWVSRAPAAGERLVVRDVV